VSTRYARRLALAALCSVGLHAALVAAGVPWGRPVALGRVSQPAPLVLDLQPAEARPRRLIDSPAPADAPIDPTDLISDKPSKAQDQSTVEDQRAAPHVPKHSDMDSLGQASPKAPVPAAAAEVSATETPEAKPVSPDQRPAGPARPAAPEPVPEPAEERIVVAQTQAPAVPRSPGDPRPSRGRVEGGVKRKGFLAFEAMEDEVAPYLLEIRGRVERQWRAALALRYSGTSPTGAIVDCAISPEGRLLYAVIVDPGASVSFAPLCKEAIERAAPFQAFPFTVPDVYRSENLEITWTFRFLE